MRTLPDNPAPSIADLNLRPLVRYVDEDRAIVDLQVVDDPGWRRRTPGSARCPVTLRIELRGSDGSIDEQDHRVMLPPGTSGAPGATVIRTEVVSPLLWWPLGMGDQPLYEMTVRLIAGSDERELRWLLGLTSVRSPGHDRVLTLVVNGRPRDIRSVVPVDLRDERRMLPVAGDALLVVRGHYGPDLLFDAADRTGALVIQAVPLHPEARPESDIEKEVCRLSAHPSLAGWYVGHMGGISEQLACALRRLDPTRCVFRSLPCGN